MLQKDGRIVMLDVSVIIPTYNRSQLLDFSLSSLEKQNLSGISFEVLVIDDGSTDNTRAIVENHTSKLNLRYFYQEKNGFRAATARNIGIKEAKGELIIFFDSGVIAVENFIYEHYHSHQINKNCVVLGNVYGLYVKLNDPVFFTLLDLDHLSESVERLAKHKKFIDVRYDFYEHFDFKLENTIAPWIYFWTCNVSILRDELIKVGMFDETFNSWGMEDIDLGFRLYQDHLPFIINFDALTIHYPHDTYKNYTAKNDTDFDNCEYFCKKYNSIESEMYYCGKGEFYNEEIRALLEHEKDRFDFDSLADTDIFRFLQNKKLLIVGAFNGALLKSHKDAWLLEYNKQNYDNIKKLYPYCQIQNRIGAKTSFGEKQFEAVLVTDFWTLIEKHWLKNILKEVMRVSENTYILYEVYCNDEIRFKADSDKVNNFISSIHELGKKARITEERSGHTRVRLFRI
jgi:Predicted glycosyltransferases